METYSISVLGADKKQYEIADFRARGMNYANAIGIIVETEFMSRVLAFDTWQEQWGNTDRILTEEQNESVAMQTFSGLDLTKRIVEAQTDIDGMTAAKRCWNYQKGGLQWYLPCLMELGVLCAYHDEINKAMKEIGCPDECLLPTEDSDATWVWSSSEYSQLNSWLVNFSNGNFNNNNKYNSNMVRAVAALNDKYVEGWFDALDDCCAQKKTSSQCVMYRLIWHEDLLDLAREVYERTYRPTTSTCFIVTRPKLREVFAANFRDRIVQHWLCLRLEPLFEARFVEHGNVSFNCRKGFGTFACIDQLTKNTIEVSDNYSHEAWYAQFDIKGFFMSIDCERLLEHLLPFIKEKWNYWKGTIYEQDLDLVLWLTEIIVRHRPQDDCIRQGNLKLWRILPKNKSLFYNEWMKGEPIGNLTSQLFANFYMSFFDEWAIKAAEERGAKYVRFVDDFSFVCKTKEDAIYFKRASRNQLRYILNIQMHPNKIYIQEVKKGIKMVGGVIKPGRAYLSNRTVGNFINAVSYLEEACKNCDKEAIYANVRSINSYLGFLIHYQSYGIRRKAFSELHYFWKACYIQGKFQVVKIKNTVQCL